MKTFVIVLAALMFAFCGYAQEDWVCTHQKDLVECTCGASMKIHDIGLVGVGAYVTNDTREIFMFFVGSETIHKPKDDKDLPLMQVIDTTSGEPIKLGVMFSAYLNQMYEGWGSTEVFVLDDPKDQILDYLVGRNKENLQVVVIGNNKALMFWLSDNQFRCLTTKPPSDK